MDEGYNNQIEKLKQVINHRDMTILMNGPSILELEKRIPELNGTDICWCGINDFWSMEENILSQIGEQYDIIICSAKENLVPDKPHIEFLNRKEQNLLVLDDFSIHPSQVEKYYGSTFPCTVSDFKRIFRDRLFFFTANQNPDALRYPTIENPLTFLAQASFTILVSLGIIGGAKRIFLFGAEGVVPEDDTTFPGNPKRAQGQSDKQRLIHDTLLFKDTYTDIMRNVCLTYDAVVPPIINCGEKSYYGVFPVKGYDECLDMLGVN